MLQELQWQEQLQALLGRLWLEQQLLEGLGWVLQEQLVRSVKQGLLLQVLGLLK